MSAVLLDRAPVEPAFLHVPANRIGSEVDEVAKVCQAMGEPLDAEQWVSVDALTSIRSPGIPARLEAGIVSARQNLKTFCLERIILTKMIRPDVPGLQPIRVVTWSAHEFPTAQETFRHFDELIETHDFLRRRVLKVSRGNGEEEIVFRVAGAKMTRRLLFRARTKTGTRGLTGDVVVLDEGFALQPAHMGSLLPTLSTRRRAQVFYGSSAGLETSGVLRGVRDRGRAGGPGAPAYVEFCAPREACEIDLCAHDPGTRGCALDREDLWLLANPALDRRISREYIAAERLALPPEEFARERLGWWDDPAGDAPISLEMWSAAADPTSVSAGRPAFGVDASPRLKSTAIIAATWRTDGRRHLEVVEYRSGTGWVLARLKELRKSTRGKIVIARGSPAFALVPDLMAARVPLELLSDAELAQGCSNLEADLRAERPDVVHTGDPIFERAVQGASSRAHGDGGWLWVRKTSAADICPIVGATVADIGLRKLVKPARDLMNTFG